MCSLHYARWTPAAVLAAILLLPSASLASRRHRPPDFNGDGYHDLAVGIPNHDIRDATGSVRLSNVGAVNVFYGTNSARQFKGVFTTAESLLAGNNLYVQECRKLPKIASSCQTPISRQNHRQIIVLFGYC
jgi:hypothetical protein